MFGKYIKGITSAFVTFLYIAFAAVIVILLIYGWNRLNGTTSGNDVTSSTGEPVLTFK